MRVLLVNVFLERIGGAEIYLHALREALSARGHEVALFAGSSEREIDAARERVVRRKEWDPPVLFSDARLEHAWTAFARGFRPDVVHVHNLFAFPADFPLALRAVGAPIVMTVHDYSLLCPNSWCVRGDHSPCPGGPGAQCFQHDCQRNAPYDERTVALARLRFELVRASFDAFLCPSGYLAERLRAHGFEHARGLPLWAESAAGAAAPPGFDQRRAGQVLFVGRLVPEKGVEFLVRAVPHLRRAVPEARLCVVGDGPERARLEALARELGVAESVEFLGRVAHEQVQQHFRAARVQVLPSIWCENSPLTIYESFQAGLPLVASDIAGLPAMVRDTGAGALAPARDARAIAARAAELLSDRAAWERCSRAGIDAFGRFDRRAHLDEIEREYAGLVQRGPRALVAPFDPDLLAALRQHYAQFARVESWALGMQAHLEHLERRIAELEGRPPAPESDRPQADRAPLVLVLDRGSALGRAALLARRIKRRLAGR